MSSRRHDLCGPTVRCEIELHLPEAAGELPFAWPAWEDRSEAGWGGSGPWASNGAPKKWTCE